MVSAGEQIPARLARFVRLRPKVGGIVDCEADIKTPTGANSRPDD